jgi:hypothetical protein
LWLGIVVVTDIGLIGWLITTADAADRLRSVLALLITIVAFAVILLIAGIPLHAAWSWRNWDDD